MLGKVYVPGRLGALATPPVLLVLAAFVVFVAACGPSPPDDTSQESAPEPGRQVVARFGEQEVTVAEADARILTLPPAERPALGTDLDAWYTDLVREMVVDSILRHEAESGGLGEDPEFQRARESAERQLGLRLCVSASSPEAENITTADLETAYTTRRDSFVKPERRFVYHLFLRRPEGTSAEALGAEAEALRDRVLRGESFARLAAERSDSESRHEEGSLGWVTREVLPAGFETVVFGLDEGVPSEPVTTRDGVHLFYVDQVFPARTLEFGDVRQTLLQALIAERSEAALNELEESITMPSDAMVLDRQELAAVVEAGDPEAMVLQLGDSTLDVADLRRAASQGQRPRAMWPVYEALLRGERIYHHCRTTGAIDEEKLTEEMEPWQDDALLRFQRQRRMAEIAGRDDERLRLFYDSNVGDFSTRPLWHVRRWSMSLGDSPSTVAGRLEAAATSRNADLDALAAKEGGEVEDLGFVDLATLRRISPKLPGLVTPLDEGGLTPPYRVGDHLEMAEVVARRASEPIPFADVRERVVRAWVEQYTQEAYEELEAEIFGDGSDFHVDPEALAALREAGQGPRDVSVDELEELFEAL